MRWFGRKTIPAPQPLPAQPDSLTDDLRRYIYTMEAAEPRGVKLRWVMNTEWLNECRKLDDSRGAMWVRLSSAPLGTPEYLLGIPIEVRDDGGVPHLERADGLVAP